VKSLRNARDKDEILRLLQAVHSGSKRLWGEMSPHQKICHLSDGFLLYMGKRAAAPVKMKYPRAAMRWVALWAPMPWPHGFPTMREIDQKADGTPPGEFQKDLQVLCERIEEFTREPRTFQSPFHPHFGSMSQREWFRLAYLHAGHHLRQFSA
jgi:hypothetical protein